MPDRADRASWLRGGGELSWPRTEVHMTEQRRVRDADMHSPIRKAMPTRQSASGPGDRISSARDIATYFREDCRTLRDSLQLEMVVAQYHLRMQGVLTREGLPVGDVASSGV